MEQLIEHGKRLGKTQRVGRNIITHCGPAKLDFGWPDWPASEKVKHDPCLLLPPLPPCGCPWMDVLLKMHDLQQINYNVDPYGQLFFHNCISAWNGLALEVADANTLDISMSKLHRLHAIPSATMFLKESC